MSKDQTTCFFFEKTCVKSKISLDIVWHRPAGVQRWIYLRGGSGDCGSGGDSFFEPMTQDNYGIFVFSVDAAAWKPSPNGLISVLLCYFKLVKLTIPPGSFQTRRWMILEFAPCPSCFLRCLHIPDHNNHRVFTGYFTSQKVPEHQGVMVYIYYYIYICIYIYMYMYMYMYMCMYIYLWIIYYIPYINPY